MCWNVTARFIPEGGSNRNAGGLSYASKVRWFVALCVGLLVLSISWDRIKCFPLSSLNVGGLGIRFDPSVNCLRVLLMLLPCLTRFLVISFPRLNNVMMGFLLNMLENDFFTEYDEASQYQIQEVIGKGSYGVVRSEVDTHTGERVGIKKIHDIFEHVYDVTCILREIKLLQLLRHPDVVEIKHILLPPSRREFKDIYVVFELMESDLHQVIKENDDLTPEHY
ncbi:hypothetical protein GIB67_034782 [Kingdonia uniflora]|uniref:Protein kinase domain-containing protein n=1 Tax=Kingdonia uniflora TaxID=39325 RepID=A0A7J7ME39_9MAGN|nr:hypothetical protein GIB67_034782 [Kingdonia uniflora]